MTGTKISVICLKWGTMYSSDYVNKLYSSILRNTTVPFDFYCFTEDATGLNPNILIKPLKYNTLEGWWNKVYLFSDEIGIGGRIFYVDLDTVITGDITNIMSVDTGFVVLRDFYTGIAKSITNQTHVGSGLMSWDAGSLTHLWTNFIKDPNKAIKETLPHGDQRWIMNNQPTRTYWQDLFPGQILSFKVHCRQGLPNDGRIICYHGKPSIPESITSDHRIPPLGLVQQAPWIAEYWRV